jgi:uncharacterized repeat protein (TIGR01451 family)
MSQTSTRVCSGTEATESEGEALAFFYTSYQIVADTPAAGAAVNITVASRLDGSLSGIGTPETVGRGMVVFALSAFPAPLPVSPGNWSFEQGISLVVAGADSFRRIPVLPQKLASTASADLSALWLRSTGKPLMAGQCFVLMGSLGAAASGGPAGNPRMLAKGAAKFDFVLPSGVRLVEGCLGARVLRQDVSVRKSHLGDFSAGGTGEYRIDVTNAGVAPAAAAITVTDTLPAGLTPVTAGGTNWSCSVAGQTVTCNWTGAPLPGGAAAPGITLRAALSAAAPASVINTVKVTMVGDQDPANDTFSDPTVIRRP